MAAPAAIVGGANGGSRAAGEMVDGKGPFHLGNEDSPTLVRSADIQGHGICGRAMGSGCGGVLHRGPPHRDLPGIQSQSRRGVVECLFQGPETQA